MRNRQQATKRGQELANENGAPVCLMFSARHGEYWVTDNPDYTQYKGFVGVILPDEREE
jgi:hypothetical protein